ncbi:hypothetical protein [Oscillibacter ruminantium]|uniref:hypothetical protein n=1 Tax=Oscillibacter ruminantium TaxID=1263547 RepID=UPI00030F01AC|nr:hypothetical protein [Oscillibacter ruminantium]
MSTQENPMVPRFTGTPSKMLLRCEECFFSRPADTGEEARQSVSIHADGRVFVSRFFFDDADMLRQSQKRSVAKIDAKTAQWLLERTVQYYRDRQEETIVCDAGSWELTITNTDGESFCYSGALIEDATEDESLSNLIRDNLDNQELWLFDGNPDRLDSIVVRYHRITKIKPGVIPPDVTWEYATWDYTEQLSIDRKTETLEHIMCVGSGCVITNQYYVEEGVSGFLDAISVSALSCIKGNPPDVIVNPMETRDYEIEIHTKLGNYRVVTGTFDRDGLPGDWADFINDIYEFISFYGVGELFDTRLYNKPRRRQSDLIFCNVQFEEYGKTYCYLTDNDELCEGDRVVVPAGTDNHEAIARIESIEYHSAENAPYPLEKVKKIIREYVADDDDADDEESSCEIPEDAVVMTCEPLPGISIEEYRDMLGDDYTESALAAALAGAWNKAGWIMHECEDDDSSPEMKARFEAWWALQEELVKKVAELLQCEFKPPYIELVTPFMERNGYRDGHGWWMKKTEQ